MEVYIVTNNAVYFGWSKEILAAYDSVEKALQHSPGLKWKSPPDWIARDKKVLYHAKQDVSEYPLYTSTGVVEPTMVTHHYFIERLTVK